MSVFLSDLMTSNAKLKMQEFTTSGVFTIPAAAKTLKITLVGGGAGGSTGGSSNWGGGSGFVKIKILNFPTDSMSTLTITIGTGGAVNTAGSASTVVQNGATILTAGGGYSTSGQADGQNTNSGGVSSPVNLPNVVGGRNAIGYGDGGSAMAAGKNGYCLIEWTE